MTFFITEMYDQIDDDLVREILIILGYVWLNLNIIYKDIIYFIVLFYLFFNKKSLIKNLFNNFLKVS